MKTASIAATALVLLTLAALAALASAPSSAAAGERTNVVNRDPDEGATMPSRPRIGPQLPPPPLPFPNRYVPGIDLDPGKPSGPELSNPAPPPVPTMQRSFDYDSTPVPATERMAAGGSTRRFGRRNPGNRGMASYTLPDHAAFEGDLEPSPDARPPRLPTFSVTPGWRDSEGRALNFVGEGGRVASMGGKLDKALIADGNKITAPGATSTALRLMRNWNRFANVWNAAVDGGLDKAGEVAARELATFYVNDYLSQRIAEGGVAWAGAAIAGVTPAGLTGYALVMLAGYGITEAVNTCVNDWELLRDLGRPRVRKFVQQGMQIYNGAGRLVNSWRPGPTERRVSGPGRPIAAPATPARTSSGAVSGGGCAAGCPPSK